MCDSCACDVIEQRQVMVCMELGCLQANQESRGCEANSRTRPQDTPEHGMSWIAGACSVLSGPGERRALNEPQRENTGDRRGLTVCLADLVIDRNFS